MKTLQKKASTTKNSVKRKDTQTPLSHKATPELMEEIPNLQGISVKATSLYSGPLPSPDAFARYDQTLPGAANRILALAEDEAKHRRRLEEKTISHNIYLEEKTVKNNIFIAYTGQICALVLGLTGLLGGIYCASINQPIPATVLSGGCLATLIAPFLKNWKSEKK